MRPSPARRRRACRIASERGERNGFLSVRVADNAASCRRGSARSCRHADLLSLPTVMVDSAKASLRSPLAQSARCDEGTRRVRSQALASAQVLAVARRCSSREGQPASLPAHAQAHLADADFRRPDRADGIVNRQPRPHVNIHRWPSPSSAAIDRSTATGVTPIGAYRSPRPQVSRCASAIRDRLLVRPPSSCSQARGIKPVGHEPRSSGCHGVA